MLLLSEKVTVLHLIKKEKKSYAEVAEIYSKDESSVHVIVKKEKEVYPSFAVTPQTAKVMAIVCDKCIVKKKKASNLYNKIILRQKERPHSHNFYDSLLL